MKAIRETKEAVLEKAIEVLDVMSFRAEEGWEAAVLREARKWSQWRMLLDQVWFGDLTREETAELTRVRVEGLAEAVGMAMMAAKRILSLAEVERIGSRRGVEGYRPWERWREQRLESGLRMVRVLEEHPEGYWISVEGKRELEKLLKKRFVAMGVVQKLKLSLRRIAVSGQLGVPGKEAEGYERLPVPLPRAANTEVWLRGTAEEEKVTLVFSQPPAEGEETSVMVSLRAGVDLGGARIRLVGVDREENRWALGPILELKEVRDKAKKGEGKMIYRANMRLEMEVIEGEKETVN